MTSFLAYLDASGHAHGITSLTEMPDAYHYAEVRSDRDGVPMAPPIGSGSGDFAARRAVGMHTRPHGLRQHL
jgi:hypothetical protein